MLLKMEAQSTDQQSGQTGAMAINCDMWIAPSIPGYQEVRDFYRRMAEKIDWTPSGNMFMANPGVSQGMAGMTKEMAKLDGVPVLQVTTMGAPGQPAAGSSQAGTQQQPAPQPQHQPQAKQPAPQPQRQPQAKQPAPQPRGNPPAGPKQDEHKGKN